MDTFPLFDRALMTEAADPRSDVCGTRTTVVPFWSPVFAVTR
jgi:hypothetical protein